MAEYMPPEAIAAQKKLVDFTSELGRQVEPEDVRERRKTDNSIPDPNQYAWWHGRFETAAKLAYGEYLRSLPDDEEGEEDNKEEITETQSEEQISESEVPEAPQEEFSEQYPDSADPFDDDPPPIPPTTESNAVELNDNGFDDNESAPPQEIEREGEEIIKLYNSEGLSEPARIIPKVVLVNYLFDCSVCIIDAFDNSRSFRAKSTGFYATSERKVITERFEYIVDYGDTEIPDPVMEAPNRFAVEETKTVIDLKIVSHGGDALLSAPFPEPRNDTIYLVSRSFIEAAREAGRSTKDLIYATKYKGDTRSEIIVEQFQRRL